MFTDFKKTFEEQSRSDAEKLIADMTSLFSYHICRQKELVNAQLVRLKDTVVGNKAFLDGQVSSIAGITTDIKRKWLEFSVQAGNDAKDCSDFSAAKHWRMELLLQECVDTTEKDSKHWENMHESMNEMVKKHVSTLSTHVSSVCYRNICDGNELHDTEIASATVAAQDDVARSSEDLIHHINEV